METYGESHKNNVPDSQNLTTVNTVSPAIQARTIDRTMSVSNFHTKIGEFDVDRLPGEGLSSISMPKNWSQVERLKVQRQALHKKLFSQKFYELSKFPNKKEASQTEENKNDTKCHTDDENEGSTSEYLDVGLNPLQIELEDNVKYDKKSTILSQENGENDYEEDEDCISLIKDACEETDKCFETNQTVTNKELGEMEEVDMSPDVMNESSDLCALNAVDINNSLFGAIQGTKTQSGKQNMGKTSIRFQNIIDQIKTKRNKARFFIPKPAHDSTTVKAKYFDKSKPNNSDVLKTTDLDRLNNENYCNSIIYEKDNELKSDCINFDREKSSLTPIKRKLKKRLMQQSNNNQELESSDSYVHSEIKSSTKLIYKTENNQEDADAKSTEMTPKGDADDDNLDYKNIAWQKIKANERLSLSKKSDNTINDVKNTADEAVHNFKSISDECRAQLDEPVEQRRVFKRKPIFRGSLNDLHEAEMSKSNVMLDLQLKILELKKKILEKESLQNHMKLLMLNSSLNNESSESSDSESSNDDEAIENLKSVNKTTKSESNTINAKSTEINKKVPEKRHAKSEAYPESSQKFSEKQSSLKFSEKQAKSVVTANSQDHLQTFKKREESLETESLNNGKENLETTKLVDTNPTSESNILTTSIKSAAAVKFSSNQSIPKQEIGILNRPTILNRNIPLQFLPTASTSQNAMTLISTTHIQQNPPIPNTLNVQYTVGRNPHNMLTTTVRPARPLFVMGGNSNPGAGNKLLPSQPMPLFQMGKDGLLYAFINNSLRPVVKQINGTPVTQPISGVSQFPSTGLSKSNTTQYANTIQVPNVYGATPVPAVLKCKLPVSREIRTQPYKSPITKQKQVIKLNPSTITNPKIKFIAVDDKTGKALKTVIIESPKPTEQNILTRVLFAPLTNTATKANHTSTVLASPGSQINISNSTSPRSSCRSLLNTPSPIMHTGSCQNTPSPKTSALRSILSTPSPNMQAKTYHLTPPKQPEQNPINRTVLSMPILTTQNEGICQKDTRATCSKKDISMPILTSEQNESTRTHQAIDSVSKPVLLNMNLNGDNGEIDLETSIFGEQICFDDLEEPPKIDKSTKVMEKDNCYKKTDNYVEDRTKFNESNDSFHLVPFVDFPARIVRSTSTTSGNETVKIIASPKDKEKKKSEKADSKDDNIEIRHNTSTNAEKVDVDQINKNHIGCDGVTEQILVNKCSQDSDKMKQKYTDSTNAKNIDLNNNEALDSNSNDAPMLDNLDYRLKDNDIRGTLDNGDEFLVLGDSRKDIDFQDSQGSNDSFDSIDYERYKSYKKPAASNNSEQGVIQSQSTTSLYGSYYTAEGKKALDRGSLQKINHEATEKHEFSARSRYLFNQERHRNPIPVDALSATVNHRNSVESLNDQVELQRSRTRFTNDVHVSDSSRLVPVNHLPSTTEHSNTGLRRTFIRTKFIVLKGEVCDRWTEIKRNTGHSNMTDPKFVHYLLQLEENRQRITRSCQHTAHRRMEHGVNPQHNTEELVTDNSTSSDCEPDMVVDVNNNDTPDKPAIDINNNETPDMQAISNVLEHTSPTVGVVDKQVLSRSVSPRPVLSTNVSPRPLVICIDNEDSQGEGDGGIKQSKDTSDSLTSSQEKLGCDTTDIAPGTIVTAADKAPVMMPPKKRKIICVCDTEGSGRETKRKKTDILSVTSKKQMTWAVNVFRDWLKQTGEIESLFEGQSASWMNEKLEQFYIESRSIDGAPYSSDNLQTIRRMLSLYLTGLHGCSSVVTSLALDPQYTSSNQALSAMMQSHGATPTASVIKQNIPILDEDFIKLYTSHTLSDQNPVSLSWKVWFDITYYLCKGRISRGFWRGLGKHSLALESDCKGVYFTLDCGETSKDRREMYGKMYAMPCLPERCPVRTTSLYLSKLADSCPALFQYPRKSWSGGNDLWYMPIPIGRDKLGCMMAKISAHAKLSQVYNNTSVIMTAKYRNIMTKAILDF